MAKEKIDKRKILIIDDDSQVCNHLRLSLIHCGFEVILIASNAADGILQFGKNSPDVTFLDINLPDQDGLSVLRKLLELDSDAHVVMVSGDSTFTNVKQSIDTGASGFIVKPFSMNKIIESLPAQNS